jgi:hypothetical protein
MLDTDTRRRTDTAHDIRVANVPVHLVHHVHSVHLNRGLSSHA